MFILKRVTPGLIALFIFSGWLLLFWRPQLIGYVAGGIFLIFLMLWINFTRPNLKGRLNFIFTPLLLLASSSAFILFIENSGVRLAVAAAVSALIFLYLEILFLFFYRPVRYQVNSLQLLTDYSNLLISFLGFSSLFSLRLFFNFSIAPLVLASIFWGFLLIFHTFWIHKNETGTNFLYGAVGGLIMAEAFWALSFLPVGYFVNGGVMAAVYYAYTNLCLSYLQGEHRPGNIVKFVIISSLSIIFVFVTASWT